MSSTNLHLQVLVTHGSAWDKNAANEFRRGVSSVVKRVADRIQAEQPHVRLEPRFVTANQRLELRQGEVMCAAIIEVSQGDGQLALLAGRLLGADVPCVVVCRSDLRETARSLGFSSAELLAYTSIAELLSEESVLHEELLRAASLARVQEELIYQFWFPRETSTVWVVCPKIHDPGEFADRSSPDYTYLDNLGDTDALLEVMVFLSQYYPNATISRFSAGDLPEGHTSGNLVVIGGPGSACGISNDISKEMMRAVGARVSYSADCEEMIVNRGEILRLQAEYSEREGRTELRRDQGYFARFRNPLNDNATVVLINGIHTRGVLGAARAFGERREALRNFHAVLASAVDPAQFEAYFGVQVLNGQVSVPMISCDNVLALGETQRPASVETAPPGRSGASGRASVRVLFIAGDRGGSQVGQIQIPKEYHEIQGALRACEHRDYIALTSPILGATRARLAEAYRERPTVIHFAGHGDNRSLSIVEDRDLVVTETPVTGEELRALLQTLRDRARLCVLNACESEALARQIVEAEAVDSAIAWPSKVSDPAAIAFSKALYGALGDGLNIVESVRVATQACGPTYSPVFVARKDAGEHPLVTVEGGGG